MFFVFSLVFCYTSKLRENILINAKIIHCLSGQNDLLSNLLRLGCIITYVQV